MEISLIKKRLSNTEGLTLRTFSEMRARLVGTDGHLYMLHFLSWPRQVIPSYLHSRINKWALRGQTTPTAHIILADGPASRTLRDFIMGSEIPLIVITEYSKNPKLLTNARNDNTILLILKTLKLRKRLINSYATDNFVGDQRKVMAASAGVESKDNSLNSGSNTHRDNVAQTLRQSIDPLEHISDEVINTEFVTRLESLENKLQNIEFSLEDVYSLIRDKLDDNVTEAAARLSAASEVNFENIRLEMDSLRNDLLTSTSRPKEVQEINHRVLNMIEKGNALQKQSINISLSARQLVDALQKRGYFLQESIAEDIISKLSTRRILVLNGVPGTGKTVLARYLAELLNPDSKFPTYTQVNVFAEASVYDSIGGLRPIKNTFAPHLGWLTDAVLKCIEANGHHWLILDEINRGDINSILAPALDAFTPDQSGFIEHSYLFPEEERQNGKIPVPGSFRIIGTMNPFDKEILFDFTHAWSRRIGFVYIPPLIGDQELKLVSSSVIGRLMDDIGWPSNELRSFLDHYRITEPLTLMLRIFTEIRNLVGREPKHLYEQCEIGTAKVLEATRSVCKKCISSQATVGKTPEEIVDHALAATLLNRATDFSPLALRVLRTEIFKESWAINTSAKLEVALNGGGT